MLSTKCPTARCSATSRFTPARKADAHFGSRVRPAWETAKSEAHSELVEEESGKSAPKRIFARLFGGATPAMALQNRDETGRQPSDVENGHRPGDGASQPVFNKSARASCAS
jgi:hypothetical protein